MRHCWGLPFQPFQYSKSQTIFPKPDADPTTHLRMLLLLLWVSKCNTAPRSPFVSDEVMRGTANDFVLHHLFWHPVPSQIKSFSTQYCYVTLSGSVFYYFGHTGVVSEKKNVVVGQVICHCKRLELHCIRKLACGDEVAENTTRMNLIYVISSTNKKCRRQSKLAEPPIE